MTNQNLINFKKEDLEQLNTGNKLLLLQAINSFEHAFQCLEWLTDVPNECTNDALIILRDRYEYFKDSALSERGCDYLIIDNMKRQRKNIEYGFELNQQLKNDLNLLRKQVMEDAQKYKSA